MHVLLLRHGQTASNAGGMIQGHLPVPLNDVGHRQAALLAARLRTFVPAIGVIVSSDLARATQTAEPIAGALGLPLALDDRWRERLMGEMQGKTVGERQTWATATGDDTPPGGETYAQFAARVLAALRDVPRPPRPDQAAAVVTHGGPIRVVLRALVAGTLRAAPGYEPADVGEIRNCSILHAVHDPAADAWRVACVNDVAHLAALSSATDAG